MKFQNKKICLKSKLSQMKIQQMAFMLIAVFLFFALVGIFVLVIRFAGIKESLSILEEENAMLLVSKLANSPEFSCGEAFSAKTNCIDSDKVMILKNKMDKYRYFWGVSNIEIRKIYPISEEKTCSLGNYPNCSIIKIISQESEGIGISNFVSLCRKELLDGKSYDKCEIAKLIVYYKEK